MPISTSEPKASDRLVILGYGFCAREFVKRHGDRFNDILATVRDPGAGASNQSGVRFEKLDTGYAPEPALLEAVRHATHVLVSVPPGRDGDPALALLGEEIAAARHLRWIGYLSTTGVYGDHAGAWIDETAPTNPVSARAVRRLEAENGWRALAGPGRVVHVFRLSGIYGPGRNPLLSLLEGSSRALDKPGQVFNRIHVEDVAEAVAAAMTRPEAGPVFNLADDEPAPQPEVLAYAAKLLGLGPPEVVAFDAGQAAMSEMARSFWAENKRVGNRRLVTELGVQLRYPTYREGLRALLPTVRG
ncbi:NAD-dependent epimerase/dehydratase family protein [Terrihabitans rhizophilus]|uniref:NAD-dependent epimerase/dehydratase family protein n=1 Tax=Terrihabitans rhizophilus TaxID=3092662 RepID=A0ABU4RLK2_9HYPH|nr:NAD-dependent epimerase/dehydratase family protein [Terrihabitans sp. PJ23]MDX6804540.1 NAD-dependent epimerase/dehydratase family protein [Terrihabitans sp. PJ23]